MPTSYSRPLIALCLAASVPIFAACVSTASPPSSSDMQALIDLNERLSRTMIVDRDPTLFETVAVAEFQVLAPGGVVEDKAQAIRGLSAWDVVDIDVSNPQLVRHGNVATISNRLDIDGTMQPVGRWGPLKSSRVFIWEAGEWRLLSQALTQCHPKAVEAGRC